MNRLLSVRSAPPVITTPAPSKEVPVQTNTAPVTSVAPVAVPVPVPESAVSSEKTAVEPVKIETAPAKVEVADPAVETESSVVLERVRPEETVCAVNGVQLQVTDNTPFTDYGGERYYFLDERAKQMFDKSQYKYTKDILTCKVCGKQEKKRGRGTQMFQEGKSEGKSYYFCSSTHKTEFMADPKKFVKESDRYISIKNVPKKK